MAGSGFKRRGYGKHISLRDAKPYNILHLKPPGCERPCLVKDHHPCAPHSLQGVTTLDQHTVMRRRRDPRYHRDRGGYGKRAGAGDDQQDERPVDRLKERHAESNRGNDHQERSGEYHTRRVVAGEPLDEGFHGGGVGLRLLDQRRNTGYGALLHRFRHPDLKVALDALRSSVYIVPRALRHRDALPGDSRLVDRRASGNDDPVERDDIPRSHDHGLANTNLLNADRHLGTVPPHPGRLWRQVEERGYRALSPPGGVLLQELGDGIEVEHGRPFGRIPYQKRARCGDGDEHGDAEPEPDERDRRGLEDIAAGYDRCSEQQQVSGKRPCGGIDGKHPEEEEETREDEDRDLPAVENRAAGRADPLAADAAGR